MSKILVNQIANYGDNSPIEVKEGVNIPAGKPLKVAGSAGTSGQVLSTTGTELQWVTPFDGSYTSLTNQPTIPAAQIQSDWNASGSSVAAILNKPIIPPQPTVTTSSAGTAALAYNSLNGEFTFTPPDLSGYLTSYTETDPVFAASDAAAVTAAKISNWDTAYGWGNHASAGYLTSYTETQTLDDVLTLGQSTSQNILTTGKIFYSNNFADLTALNAVDAGTYHGMFAHVHDEGHGYFAHAGGWTQLLDIGSSLGELGDVNLATAPQTGQVLKYDGSNWVAAADGTGGGGIALTDLSVTTAAAGTAALSYNNVSGVFTYTPPDLSGYLTSYTETDPVFAASDAAAVTAAKITNWDTAYGWGDHGAAGYTTTSALNAAVANSGNWDTAYGWGDHATAGYLGSQATNVIIGNATTGAAITTAVDNVVLGNGSGTSITTGYDNVILGWEAGTATTNQTENVFIGSGAGKLDIGDYNIAIGTEAGDAYWGDTSGCVENVAIGRYAGQIRNGSGNIAIGNLCLPSNSSEFIFGNVCIGYQAMSKNNAIDGADRNVSVGEYAGYAMTSGSRNVAIGPSAGSTLTTGENNILFGVNAGDDITTGSNNIILNSGAYQNGTIAGFVADTSDSLWIGYSSYPWIKGTSSGNTRNVEIPGQLTAGGLAYPTTNGTSGDVLTSDGAGNVTWSTPAGGGANVTISDTAPGSATAGDLWWESDKGRLKIYYNDTDSTQWVDASPPLGQPNVPVAVGNINMNANSPAWTGTTGYTVAKSGGDGTAGGGDVFYTLTFPTAYSARTDYIVQASYDGTDFIPSNGAQIGIQRNTTNVVFCVRRWNEDPLNLGDIMITITNL